jgi:GntR family transcriptional regulator
MLNRNDVVPLYIQLQRTLKQQILKGEYEQGGLLPSETSMMKTFQTTRATVRKAISQLANEGLVRQIQGKGTYVNFSRLKYSVWNFGGFTDYLKSRNETPVSKVLSQDIVSVDGKSYFELKRARGVKKDNSVLYLTIDTSLLPADLFPGIEEYDFASESLYRVIREEYGIYPDRSEIVLSSVQVDNITRDILQINAGVPSLLQAWGVVLDKSHVEIEKVTVVYSPEIEFKLVTSME